MDQLDDFAGEPHAHHASELSTCFTSLLPVDRDDVAPFLKEVADALGETEADLARRLSVSHATLSSWKRRGAIPEPHLAWFARELVPQIFRVDPQSSREGFHHRGLEVALAVFKQTDFDPFDNLWGKEVRHVEQCFRLVSPMSRLGLFVQNRLQHRRLDQKVDDFLWDQVTPKVIELAKLGTVQRSLYI